ncbi:MAG: peptidoglycan DD-metalloendopeptidase family protein [Nitrosomonadales bacterium]|nr:peptidoglycan DD-metalloendopeptidase family protein [Nitrosomonadales bacterium]
MAGIFNSLPVSANTKVDQSKAELNALHKKIEALNKDLNTSREAHRDAADELKDSEKAISEANRKLHELNLQQKKNREALAALEKQQSALVATLETQQQLLGKQLYQQYLHGQQNHLQIILQQEDPNEVARQLHYFSYVSKARAELIDGMQDNLKQMTAINEKTTEALKEIEALKIAQEQERKSLQAQKAERSKVLKKLSTQIANQRNEINKLKRDEKRLSSLVERLAQIARDQAAAKRKKAQAAQKKPTDPKTVAPKTIAKNQALPSSQYDGSNFAALKGKLNLPVRGEVTNRYGAARQDTGVSWKGLFIRAPEGAEVKSVAKGSVVFADWLRGFGNLIIIDHGDGYMSLYGNNQSLLKNLGDDVKGGDTIAAVGNTGGNESSGLYFELRRQSKTFDPLAWSVIR